jgi:hypothetical protein
MIVNSNLVSVEYNMNLSSLINNSKNINASIYSPVRTQLLSEIQDILNNKLRNLNIVDLGTLSIIGSRIKLYSPSFWTTLGHEVLRKVDNIPIKHANITSILFYNYVISFPFMPSEFFNRLENKIVEKVAYLDFRTICQAVWCLGKRGEAQEATIASLEDITSKKIMEMNLVDISQISIAIPNLQTFGMTQNFKDSYLKAVNKKANEMTLLNMLHVLKALPVLDLYDEKLLNFICTKFEANIDKFNKAFNKDIAISLGYFNKGLEIPFFDKLHENRIENKTKVKNFI